MTHITGKHLIAGLWIEGPSTFQSDNPTTGEKNEYSFFDATPELVDQAVFAARGSFEAFAKTSPFERANFLRTIADEINARGDDITKVAHSETALPAARLEMERGRTVGQLKFFADWIEEGSWLGARIELANPERAPLPKPDIRSFNKAIGPVVVFGASNFPLAFSTAGGDTASALAAGCPVIVKAHQAHPGTCELIAQAIQAAIKKCNMPNGVFSQLQGGNFSVGQSLVAHPDIKAVGFTGSLGGGRALFNIAVNRAQPIPFYGELGSNNPVFLLREAMKLRAKSIGEAWAQSLTMGVGQFCTNPGVIVALKGAETDTFITNALNVLEGVIAQPMLTSRIAKCYQDITQLHAQNDQVTCLLEPKQSDNAFYARPGVFKVDAKAWLNYPDLSEEIFGPSAFIVECANETEVLSVASAFNGQLTATLQMNDEDKEVAAQLIAIMEEKAGRVLINAYPTGVEVCHSMVHGGPYPASTDVKSTSVGSLAIERFIRPISYQGLPDSLLPPALQNANPLSINRLVDGKWKNSAL
jgi:2,5-dioxopentanoate dehydrogenase